MSVSPTRNEQVLIFLRNCRQKIQRWFKNPGKTSKCCKCWFFCVTVVKNEVRPEINTWASVDQHLKTRAPEQVLGGAFNTWKPRINTWKPRINTWASVDFQVRHWLTNPTTPIHHPLTDKSHHTNPPTTYWQIHLGCCHWSSYLNGGPSTLQSSNT